MASISRQPNGRKTIQFVAANGRRKSIRLGKTSQRNAEAIKVKVESLNAAVISGQPIDSQTARWVAELDVALAQKLSRAGLISQRGTKLLGPFLDEYLRKRADVKPSTKTNWRHTRRNLLEFFGADKPLDEITLGDAEDFECYLKTTARENRYVDKSADDGLSGDTVRKRISNARQFFKNAVKHEFIARNPFDQDELKTAVRGNRDRDFFVTLEMAYRVLDACPDAQWRLIFALSRFGGLRCPSEHLRLRLDDVDWERERLRVWSPKTEHHVGKRSRIVPLFPELHPYMQEVWHQAEPGEEYFITRYRHANQNLRTQLIKIIRRAGLEPWPKLFQNLRSSRQTELEEILPSHVVCAWIGNSERVARKHYLQVTDDHFDRALQNPVQQAAEARKGDKRASTKKSGIPVEDAAICRNVHTNPVGDTGFEPVTSAV